MRDKNSLLRLKLYSMRRCCIRRNPTKGIERPTGQSQCSDFDIACVAFEEIPQRELRENLCCLRVRFLKPTVAFEEIPQRELRVSSGLNLHVNLKTLRCIRRNPTKGIERLVLFPLLFGPAASRCIRRNPTKGIEREVWLYPTAFATNCGCIRRNPTKGIESV